MKDKIYQNLNNGFEGGYTELMEWSPEEIVSDLQSFASDMEDVPSAKILPHVISWQEEQRIKKAEVG